MVGVKSDDLLVVIASIFFEDDWQSGDVAIVFRIGISVFLIVVVIASIFFRIKKEIVTVCIFFRAAWQLVVVTIMFRIFFWGA